MFVKLMLVVSTLTLASCASTSKKRTQTSGQSANINNKTKFSSAAYGVKGSPRVTTSRKVKKGGGRYQVGKPYKIRGKWYRPKAQPGYNKTGMASWYGPNFHGRLTANGEVYDQYSLSAAHPTLPLPSYAKVTNLENGSSVIVRINDRGPFSNKRIIDLSAKASKLLGYQKKGLAKVRVRYIGKARMDGLDARYLTASYKPGRGQRRLPNIPGFNSGSTRPGTLLASMSAKSSRNQKSTQIAFAQPVKTPPPGALNPILSNGAVPVPLLRPTQLNVGFAMDLASTDQITTRPLQPLGFISNQHINRRVARAFDVVNNQYPSHNPVVSK